MLVLILLRGQVHVLHVKLEHILQLAHRVAHLVQQALIHQLLVLDLVHLVQQVAMLQRRVLLLARSVQLVIMLPPLRL